MAGLMKAQPFIESLTSSHKRERKDFSEVYKTPYKMVTERPRMDKEEIDRRVEKFVNERKLYILRDGDAAPGAQRLVEGVDDQSGIPFRTLIERATAGSFVKPQELEAILFLESYGDPSAVVSESNSKKPRGIAMFDYITATADYVGLKVGGGVDERMIPAKAIPAAVRYLKWLKDDFGLETRDFAIAAYHSGPGRQKSLKNLFKEESGKPTFSYSEVFFRPTPYDFSKTYQRIKELMQLDFSPTYFARIQAAQELLSLYRTDREGFQEFSEYCRKATKKYAFKNDRPPYKYWAWYEKESLEYHTVQDIVKALDDTGELVPVESRPDLGLFLRTNGKGSIGEKALPEHQRAYRSLKPAGAGCLLLLARKLQELRYGRPPIAIEVTSLVRDMKYQVNLKEEEENPTALVLPLHLTGVAFDVAQTVKGKALSESDIQDIRFVLDELDTTGMISWSVEMGVFRVVVSPDPDAQNFLKGAYEDLH
jgi:hypothetical protein